MREREARRAGGERITWSAEELVSDGGRNPQVDADSFGRLRVKNEMVTKRLVGELKPSK